MNPVGELAWRIVRDSAPLLGILVLVQMLTGQLLNSQEERLLQLPILLALVPAVNGIGGNIGSVLGARLASGLHSGLVSPRLREATVRRNVLSAILVAAVTYGVLAGLVRVFGPALGLDVRQTIWELLLLLLGSGLLLTIILSAVTVVTAVVSFRRGKDPDNMVIPIVTTLGDLLGVASLLAVAQVVLT